MLVPDVFSTRTAPDFVRALVGRNCGEGAPKPLSQRAFAAKLGWSSGFLTDVLKGRKALSIPRAAQLALDCKLDGFGRERLVLLSAFELLTPKQRAKFQQVPALGYEGTSDKAFSLDVFRQSQLMLLYNVCGAFPARLAAKTIRGLVPVLGHLDDLQIDSALRKLEDLGFVSFKDGAVKCLPAFWRHGDKADNMSSHVPYLKNLIRFCEKPWAPGFTYTAQMAIPKRLYPEIAVLIKDIVRRIYDAAMANEGAGPDVERCVYQLDLNFISMLAADADGPAHRG